MATKKAPATSTAHRTNPVAFTDAASLAKLERVRKACLALDGAAEKLAHGEPTFRVKDRVFVMFANNHHDDGRLALWCNAAAGEQLAAVEADGVNFFVPPYVGVRGWLGVRLDKTLAWPDVKRVIEAAYRETVADHARAKAKRAKK